jgi:hypothetical protein
MELDSDGQEQKDNRILQNGAHAIRTTNNTKKQTGDFNLHIFETDSITKQCRLL